MITSNDTPTKLCMKCLKQEAKYDHNMKCCHYCANICSKCLISINVYKCCNEEYCHNCLHKHKEDAHYKIGLKCCNIAIYTPYDMRSICHYCQKNIHSMCRYSSKNELDMCQKCAQIYSTGQVTCSHYNYDLRTHCKNELLSRVAIRCVDCNLPFCQSHVETIFIKETKKCQTRIITDLCHRCKPKHSNQCPSAHQHEHKFCHVCDIGHCSDEGTDYCMNCSKKSYIHQVLLNNICYICNDDNQIPTIKTNLCCDCHTSNFLLINQIGNHLPGDINLSRIVAKYMKICLPIHETPINCRHVTECIKCRQYVCKQHQNRDGKIKCLNCFNNDCVHQ